MSLLSLALVIALGAEDGIPIEQAAKITLDQQKATAEVAKKYGNKKSSELSTDERREFARDQAAAEKAVLEKNGVDAKTWARQSLKQTREEYAATQDQVKVLAEKEKAAAEKAAKDAKGEQKEVQVQRGISDENPVTIDEQASDDGKISVEKGLPPESDSDQAAAKEQDRLEGAGDATDSSSKPAPKSKGGKRR